MHVLFSRKQTALPIFSKFGSQGYLGTRIKYFFKITWYSFLNIYNLYYTIHTYNYKTWITIDLVTFRVIHSVTNTIATYECSLFFIKIIPSCKREIWQRDEAINLWILPSEFKRKQSVFESIVWNSDKHRWITFDHSQLAFCCPSWRYALCAVLNTP